MSSTDHELTTSGDRLRKIERFPGRRNRVEERRFDSPHIYEEVKSEVGRSLDSAYEQLTDARCDQSQVAQTMDKLFPALRTWKLNSSDEQWQDLIQICRRHRLKDLFHQDPFTYRAFSKPRNYPGDAELIDYIYGPEEQWPAPEASPLGRSIFNCTIAEPAPEGVRARRGFVADVIDRLAAETTMPHVFSIAAGHLREANLSGAVKRKKLGRLVALDNDPISLEEIRRCYSRYGVETVQDGIRRLLTNQADLGSFDLIYSTGLFDYLQQSTGRRLVWGMFQMLRPGGRLVVANFLPGVRNVGYMEAFMDWQLIYRARHEMADLSMEIPEEDIRDVRIFSEENLNIIFLQVTKK